MTPQKQALFQSLRTAYGDDAMFRPSSADRFIGCPGSVQLVARASKTRRSSSYADEGTAAHIVVEQALRGERQPDEWAGRMVRVDKEGMRGVFVDEEMVLSAETYLAEVAERWTPDTEQFIEYKLSLGALDPLDALLHENRGTADCVLVDRRRRKLTIIDLKYGRGVMVAAGSYQLRDYALMGLVTFGVEGGWDEVETVVVQPRAAQESERIKPQAFDPNELLMDFLGQVAQAMDSALEPDPPLNTGSWCRWCPARPICPALRSEAMSVASAQTPAGDASRSLLTALAPLPSHVYVGTIEEPRPAATASSSDTLVLPPGRSMSSQEIGIVLARRDLFKTWLTSIEEYAVQLLEAGQAIPGPPGHPGWVLKRRSGNRRFMDEKCAVDALRDAGLQIAQIYTEPKLKSPRQIEILLSKERKGVLEGLVERPLGDLTLVRADDVGTSQAAPLLGALDA